MPSRFCSTALLSFAVACCALVAQPPKKSTSTDLSGFKTVATAQKTTIKTNASSTFRAPQPAYLGIFAERGQTGQMVVTEVIDGSPAAEAEIKVGDELLGISGEPLATKGELRDVLTSKEPGQQLPIQLRRYSDDRSFRLVTVLARLGKLSDPRPDRGRRVRGPNGETFEGWSTYREEVWTKDTYRLAVIPFEFADVKHNEKITVKAWDEALFSEKTFNTQNATGQPAHGSVNDYYREISYGKFGVTGKVFKYVALSKKRDEYKPSDQRTALFTEVLENLRKRDGDDALKEFDGICFIYAGDREKFKQGDAFWPHRASFRYGGRRWGYFICPEGGEQMFPISVIAHEFGHMLGLPDLYGVSGTTGTRTEGAGLWCTMSIGHGLRGRPVHYSAWSKEQMGWIEPAIIDPRVKQKLILSPILESNKECFKILLRPDGLEYLLLENRVKKKFDQDLPGEGLLIWRVVRNRPVLQESHGLTDPLGSRRYPESVPYPSKSNNAYTPQTTPSSQSDHGENWPVHITNIRRLPDGRITFYVGYELY